VPITLGSLFDGIGGFPYAASFYGVRTLWASEVLAQAISVTRRHFLCVAYVLSGIAAELYFGSAPDRKEV
jgi:DNA (cytosine-5)-methyltransferase 1